MAWKFAPDSSGPQLLTSLGAGNGSTASLEKMTNAYAPRPNQQQDGGFRSWQQGWNAFVPPVGLGPFDPRANLPRVPSPGPHISGFSIAAPSAVGPHTNGFSAAAPAAAKFGGPIDVPVELKAPAELKAPSPQTLAEMQAMLGQGLSPGPPHVRLPQPQLQSSRSVSPRQPGGFQSAQQGGSGGMTPRQASPVLERPQWGVGVRQQKQISMPASLLARIDGVVSEMERELSEAEHESPEEDLQALSARVAAEHSGGKHWASYQNLLDVGKQRQPREDEHQQVSARDFASDINKEDSKNLHGKLSALSRDHLALRQHLEEEIRSVKDAVTSRPLHHPDRISEFANGELSKGQITPVALETQALVEARLCEAHAAMEARLSEAHAALEREQRFSEEANDAQQAAEIDLRNLEEKSRDVLRDCRTLQAKVMELEAERLQMKEALVAAERRIEQLESDLVNGANSSPLAANSSPLDDRARVHELQEKLAAESARLTEVELELADLRCAHDHHQNHAKITSARATELEDQLGRERAVQEHREGEVQIYVAKLQEFENLLEKSHSSEVQLKHHIQDLEMQLAELRNTESRHQLELEHCRAEVERLEERHQSAQESHARAASAQRLEISKLEQQAEDAAAANGASVRQHRQKVQDLEQELFNVRAAEENHVHQNSVHKTTIVDLERQLEELRVEKEHQAKHHGNQRAHVLEMEKRLDEHQAVENNHGRQLSSLRSRILELEQEVEDARAAREGAFRQFQSQKARTAQLEQDLEQGQAAEAEHHRQHHQHKSKISELEQRLVYMTSNDESHTRQHATLREQLHAMKTDYENVKSSEAQHQRNALKHQSRVEELEREVESVRGSHGTHLEQINVHKQEILQLEKQLTETRSSEKDHMMQVTTHQQKVAELDREVTALRAKEAAFKDAQDRTEQDKRERLQALEEALEQAKASEVVHLDRHKLAVSDHAEQVRLMTSELSEERDRVGQHKGELDRARLAAEEARQEHQKMIDVERSLREKIEQDLENYRLQVEKVTRELERERDAANQLRASQADNKAYRWTTLGAVDYAPHPAWLPGVVIAHARVTPEQVSALVRNGKLQETCDAKYIEEAPLASKSIPSPRSAVPSSEYMDDLTLVKSQIPLSSLPEETTIHSQFLTLPREEIRRKHRQDSSVLGVDERTTLRSSTHFQKPLQEFLPDNRHPFVGRVRRSDMDLQESLAFAHDVHAKSITGQLVNMMEAYEHALPLKEGLQKVDPATVAERRQAADGVQAVKHDMLALKDEVEVEHDLDPTVKREVVERLKLDLARCEEELRLLHPSAPLVGIPENTLMTLMGVQQEIDTGQPISNERWADDFSPMHWAAQHNRKDIINYLISLDGGAYLLNARDKHGRTPLYYAKPERRPALAQFLVDSGATMPMHSKEERPDVSTLPTQYQRVLQQIESFGWASMNWKDNYTMLHWAAEKGLGDLCRYLINMDADPNTRDGKYRTASECARESRHPSVAELLQELENKPRNTFNLTAFAPGSSAVPFVRSQTAASEFVFDSADDRTSVASSTSNGKGVPEPYIKVMEQIDRVGWEKMAWARNFTLLHWAAKNDRPDLIKTFMFQRADPNHRDDTQKSAVDYAKENDSLSALEQLETGPPEAEPALESYIISRKPRGSTLVEGRPRQSVQHLLLDGSPSTNPSSFVTTKSGNFHRPSVTSEMSRPSMTF